MVSTPSAPSLFGSWRSPISIDATLSTGVDLIHVITDGDDVLWGESIPSEDARITIKRLRDGQISELTPRPCSVRSRVNEYGGGAFAARDGYVVWSDDSVDGAVMLLTPDGKLVRVSAPGRSYRYGDLRVHPAWRLILAVREDHSAHEEPVTTIVALPWPDNSLLREDIVLCEGANFYASPELNDDGLLAWCEWNHPHMPWDASTIKVGRLDSADVTDVRVISGGGIPLSPQHPRWSRHGLLFMSDANGYWNLHLWDGKNARAVHDHPYDFDYGQWVLENTSYALLDDNLVLTYFFDGGICVLSTIDLRSGELVRLDEVAAVDSLADGGYGIVSWPAKAPELVRITDHGITETIVQAADNPDPDYTSIAQPLTFTGSAGDVHAWYYPPVNSDAAAIEGELPPMIVKTHGGPTSFASSAWNPNIQFWTSRGFAILDVNYSGSTGFGRHYRERLNGQWGVIDVSDVIDAVKTTVASGLADPARVVITGGSAGGYTSLQALVTSDVFAAGVSSYGISDLTLLIADTHKFEAHYPEILIGPWPQAKQIYLDRSPINHVERLSSPMLIFQGEDDHVVPPAQAVSMAHALNAQGLPFALVMFPGEGHGFRNQATRRSVFEAQLSFFAQLFGFTPADEIPVLDIENLH